MDTVYGAGFGGVDDIQKQTRLKAIQKTAANLMSAIEVTACQQRLSEQVARGTT
jgi:hypothetical protein